MTSGAALTALVPDACEMWLRFFPKPEGRKEGKGVQFYYSDYIHLKNHTLSCGFVFPTPRELKCPLWETHSDSTCDDHSDNKQ